MNIRPATRGDASAVAEILNPIIRDTTISFKPDALSVDEVSDMIATAKAYFVAELDGNVAGFASYNQFRNGGGYARAMEHTIVIAPEAQGQGVGEALMARLADHARAAGVGSLWAGVSGDNPAGKAFHARVGFEEVAVLPKVGFKFGKWRDLTLMRKWLDPDGDAPEQSG